jgi:hypothetical protein
MARIEARKAQRAVIKDLEQFAKRSKHINIISNKTFWGRQYTTISVLKDTKVTKELIAYPTEMCKYINIHTDETYPTDFYRTYDDLRDDSDDIWKVEFNIAVRRY